MVADYKFDGPQVGLAVCVRCNQRYFGKNPAYPGYCFRCCRGASLQYAEPIGPMPAPYIETDCTFGFEGHTYEAGGAVVTPNFAIGYFTDDQTPTQLGMHVGYRIIDWHGNDLGRAKLITSWPTPRSYESSRMYQVEATIDGITYTGRCAGFDMIWKGKRKAHA